MVRTLKIIIWLGGVLLGCLYLLTYSTGGSARSAVIEPALSGPVEIYTASCARCHGADGRAKTAKGKRVGATDFTSDWNTDEARGIRIITNGKSEMPAFKGKLTANEIRSVFGYILRFRR